MNFHYIIKYDSAYYKQSPFTFTNLSPYAIKVT